MPTHDRRSVLAALGLAVPFGLDARARAAGPPPGLRFRPFEDAVREAFATPDRATTRRVEVGHSDEVRAGLQGCHNDRPFAGFAAGQLRIVRTGAAPGPVGGGVRLYVATVDIAVSQPPDVTGRPFDFASLPPAPVLVSDKPQTEPPVPSVSPRRPA